MNLYVIIVTFNGARWIRDALHSLRLSEMICTPVVVDNASTDETVKIVQREFPEAVLIPKNENTGFGHGNNVGISFALARGAKYIFLLNQDAYVTPTTLGLLTGFLEEHPQYAVASPLHCSPDLSSLDPQTQRAYLQRYAAGYLSDACLGKTKDFYQIGGINAAAWMVRAVTFKKVGGFDPIFFMYGEDDDLIARFAYLGERFALLPTSHIVHLRAKSSRPPATLPRQLWTMSERVRSELLVDMKHPHGRWSGKLMRLFSAGILLPIARSVSDHNWKDVCVHLLGTLRVLSKCRTVFGRAKLCGTRGAHFLDV